MSNDFNFGNGMQGLGTVALQELLKTDYGPKCSFDAINGHPLKDHHGGPHCQTTLFKSGVSDSHINVRIFED